MFDELSMINQTIPHLWKVKFVHDQYVRIHRYIARDVKLDLNPLLQQSMIQPVHISDQIFSNVLD